MILTVIELIGVLKTAAPDATVEIDTDGVVFFKNIEVWQSGDKTRVSIQTIPATAKMNPLTWKQLV
jgi:hypothetical protein